WKALNALARLGGKPLNPPNLFELHRILTQSTLDPPEMAGRLRTDPDPRPILDPGDGSILHLPPGPQSLPKRLMTLGRFANMGSSQPFIHPLIQAIILHFMVAYDHPFVDGNGRLARILFYWHMAKHGYKIMDAVSISEILAEGPEPYRQAFLETQTDHNDLTHFILHQLAVLKRSLARTRNLGAIQMRETRTTAARLKQKGDRGKFLNFRQLALMGHALDHPGHIYDIHQHRQTHGLAYDTARKDLLLLSDARRWLIRKKAGKAFVFIAPQDLEAKLSSSK
ncbi:MAG: Fic family protein, partial [Nitrospinales bacterium]